ncbi:TetR/AcrR family transcriptional regulator [Pseudofrankia sp. BMG5.37]|uniref:TetR/AcrR family transcriptional regulator n=1 Tax=Pseudofrankia sp. BMG5.36 TaxID=1834512 RepID=UPI002378E6AA|nr:TetR/AcrR family transcriptional regulator [Pseudofrankia sp. BMG5.36]MDT3446556.1 TetR/AcrR family transcriptional regulator [Pseudofrankia sp. BMG5.37]
MRAAIEIFGRRGYSRATLEEVGSRVGLTKSTVYHYFASKAELLDAICDEATTNAEDALSGGLAVPGDPADRVREALRRYTQTMIRHGSLPIVMRHFDELTPNFRRYHERRREALVRQLADALDEGVRAGALASDDTEISALSALGSINWLYTWYQPPGRLSPDQVCSLLVAQIMNGLTPRPGGQLSASRPPHPGNVASR